MRLQEKKINCVLLDLDFYKFLFLEWYSSHQRYGIDIEIEFKTLESRIVGKTARCQRREGTTERKRNIFTRKTKGWDEGLYR